MKKIFYLTTLLYIICIADIQANDSLNYQLYHLEIVRAEKEIAKENYKKALQIYEQLFHDYDFIFLREYQVATQLALKINAPHKARTYLKKGILSGWTLKSIKKNKFLSPFIQDVDWKTLVKEYAKLRNQYESRLNQATRSLVKKMYAKDQQKAFKAIFRFTSKGQDRYAEKKFAPHSEQQIAELLKIMDLFGYPGEKLIGNNYWTSTILSHHNSISTTYNQNDTLYPNLRPKLLNALKRGEISPYELALIDDWYISAKANKSEPIYGILDAPTSSDIFKTNELRASIYLRPYELRAELITIQEKTGMNFHMTDRWY